MRHVILRIFGPISSVFVALCCLGVPAVIAALSAVGAGFLINDAVLIPLLIIALGITIAGSFLSFRQYRNLWPLGLTVVSSAVVVGGILFSQPAVAYSALVIMMVTQFGDLAYQRGWLAPFGTGGHNG
jgi:mercuric ion transport protein